MRLEAVKTNVERGGKFIEKPFTIKADSKMFNLLSDYIYSDKVGAIVREIASNAKDAHIAAGCPDRAFEIHLPNIITPYFSVRDYGKGLTHEEMFDIYATYSESTKTNTNTVIGAFGIGAKSPFAYTNNFTVVSYTGKSKRIYAAYIGEEGIPVLTLLNEELCSDESGLEVIVPVKEQDFDIFRDKTFHLLQYLTPLPKVFGIADQYNKFEEHSYLYQGDNWGIRKNKNGGARVIQGEIFYPIDFYAVYEQKIPNHLYRLTHLPIDLYFDMTDGVDQRGNLGVALSREALSYDQYTREQIQKTMQQAYEEVRECIVDDLNQAATFWEACIKYTQLKNTFADIIPTDVKWRGEKTITHTVHVPVKEYNPYLEFTLFTNQQPYRNGMVVDLINAEYNNIKFFFNDVKKGAKTRIKHSMKNDNNFRRVYLIEFKSDSQEAKEAYNRWVQQVGHPPVTNVSTLPKPKVVKPLHVNNKQYNKEISCIAWEFQHYPEKVVWKPTMVDLNKGGYYIILPSSNRFTDYSSLMVANVFATNIIPKNVPVYGIKKGVAKQIQSLPAWKNLVELINYRCSDQQIKQIIEYKCIRNEIKSITWYDNSLSTIKHMLLNGLKKSKAVDELIIKVDDGTVKEFLRLLLKYQFECDEKDAERWCDLSKYINAGHYEKNCTQYHTTAKQYVDELSKLWENIIMENKILRYMKMDEFGNPEFNEVFIEIVNKGV